MFWYSPGSEIMVYATYIGSIESNRSTYHNQRWYLFSTKYLPHISHIIWHAPTTQMQGAELVNLYMMTSSKGNSYRVTGPLRGEFTGHRWIPRTKASDAELWCFCFFICAWINGWVTNREVGDLIRPRAHYDVTAMNRNFVIPGTHSGNKSFFAHCDDIIDHFPVYSKHFLQQQTCTNRPLIIVGLDCYLICIYWYRNLQQWSNNFSCI